jgi:hypothetical protein
VEGTTTNPKFVPDKDTIFGTQKTSSSGKAQSKNALGNALNQFFKKKK